MGRGEVTEGLDYLFSLRFHVHCARSGIIGRDSRRDQRGQGSSQMKARRLTKNSCIKAYFIIELNTSHLISHHHIRSFPREDHIQGAPLQLCHGVNNFDLFPCHPITPPQDIRDIDKYARHEDASITFHDDLRPLYCSNKHTDNLACLMKNE
jgi:hypothetical protein